VSFFEGLELPAWDEPEEEPHESPEWLEAPRGWLGGQDDAPDPSTQIALTSGGGGGGALDTHQSYWVWPLPPPGRVTFACEWPKLEIAETQVAVEGDVIRGAAGRAERVWPPDDKRV
jgi:hypothetical protein